MSPGAQDNIAFVEQFADTFNGRDLDSLLALCHADIELHTPAGTFRGHEGVRKWARKQWTGSTPVEVATDRIVQAGDDLVVHHCRLLFRWSDSGEVAQAVPVRAEFTISGGRLMRWQGAPTDNSARQAP